MGGGLGFVYIFSLLPLKLAMFPLFLHFITMYVDIR